MKGTAGHAPMSSKIGINAQGIGIASEFWWRVILMAYLQNTSPQNRAKSAIKNTNICK